MSGWSGFSAGPQLSGWSGPPGESMSGWSGFSAHAYSGWSGPPGADGSGLSGWSSWPQLSGFSGWSSSGYVLSGWSGRCGWSGKQAILAFTDGVNRALFCTEAPMAIFDDIVELTVIADQSYAWVPIDSLFIEACEPDTIVPTGAVAETPVIGLAASVSAGAVRVDLAEPTMKDVKVHVRLTGKRRGMTCRFPARSDEAMRRNSAFWAQAHHN